MPVTLGKFRSIMIRLGKCGSADLGERLNGFLAVVTAHNLRQYPVGAQSFLHQKHIRVVVFDDEDLAGLPGLAIDQLRPREAAQCRS